MDFFLFWIFLKRSFIKKVSKTKFLQKLLFLILINSIILIYFLLTKNFIKKGFNFCHISLYSLYIILSTDFLTILLLIKLITFFSFFLVRSKKYINLKFKHFNLNIFFSNCCFLIIVLQKKDKFLKAFIVFIYFSFCLYEW